MLRQAIDLFLATAYSSGEIPDAVRTRGALDPQRSVAEQLADLRFERYQVDAPLPCVVHALRLGSRDYPHLKLEIRPFPNRFGFLFWVNTHDQFYTPDARCRDAERWQKLIAANSVLKEAIERRWTECGLPTFQSTMREKLAEGPDAGAARAVTESGG
jgi:hypothetical protein